MATIKHRFEDVEYIDVAHLIVKHKDFVYLKGLYTMMHEWYIENGYGPRKDAAFPEAFYFQKEEKGAREIWAWWRGAKTFEGNSYYKYTLDMDMHVVALKDTEIIHKGTKFKTNWGEPEIKIWARLILDYQDTWKKHWLLKNFNEVFHKRIFVDEFDQHRLTLYRDAVRFQDAVKRFFKMKTFIPEPELHGFGTEKGLGEPQ